MLTSTRVDSQREYNWTDTNERVRNEIAARRREEDRLRGLEAPVARRNKGRNRSSGRGKVATPRL